jgi:hypothetical protein
MTTRHKIYVIRQFAYIHGAMVERDFTNSKGENTKVYNHSQPNSHIHPIFSHSKAPYFLMSFPFSLPSFFFLTKWSYYTGYTLQLQLSVQLSLSSALPSSPALYHIYRRVTSWLSNFLFKKAAANCFFLFGCHHSFIN